MTSIYFVAIDGREDYPFVSLLRRVSPGRRREILRRKAPQSRKAALYGSLLVRRLACDRLGLANSALDFGKGFRGKPELQGSGNFHFNISHTQGALVVAAGQNPVGVDIEKQAPYRDKVAKRCFVPEETRYVLEDSDNADRRFAEVWTKKEAYLKYTGNGLAVSARSFNVLSPPVAELFHACWMDEYHLVCCCEGEVAQPVRLEEKELIETFLTLEPL